MGAGYKKVRRLVRRSAGILVLEGAGLQTWDCLDVARWDPGQASPGASRNLSVLVVSWVTFSY